MTDWILDRAPENHAVKFYDDEGLLCEHAARFLAEGSASGAALLLLATPRHAQTITSALRATGIDPSLLHVLDAVQLLADATRDDAVDLASLISALSAALAEYEQQARPLYAYGELADLLVETGHAGAALALEQLWSDFAATHPSSVLCSHSLDHFYGARDADGRFLHAICGKHGQASTAV